MKAPTRCYQTRCTVGAATKGYTERLSMLTASLATMCVRSGWNQPHHLIDSTPARGQFPSGVGESVEACEVLSRAQDDHAAPFREYHVGLRHHHQPLLGVVDADDDHSGCVA